MKKLPEQQTLQLSDEAIGILQHLRDLPDNKEKQSPLSIRFLFVNLESCVEAQKDLSDQGLVGLEEFGSHCGIKWQRLTPLGIEYLSQIPAGHIITDKMFQRSVVLHARHQYDMTLPRDFQNYFPNGIELT